MRRAKRWLLVFAALLGLMAHAGALRASSFMYGKSTTTSSTTTSTPASDVPETTAAVVEEVTEPKYTVHNVHNITTKPSRKLTGIPQIDWVWDPNLPRELNGYNLSSYPFFSTVPPPEDIAFRCDGLHDGFYASIEFKCQVYHHCVYGIRHDFLCANFTAFDQRTFICHFVSDVDCKNSEKFWNRNDNLYMATTTTTTTTTTTPAPITPEPEYRPRPRRPLRRRRPSDYYYDEDYDADYYEEDRRVNRRRKQRPRGRRPADYDEDYEERRAYSDEEPRPEKRPKNRDRFRDSVEEDYVDDRRTRTRPRPKAAAVGRQGDGVERRKIASGRKGPADRQSSLDERRSLSDDRGDRPRNRLDDAADFPERRPIATGRRRPNGERRPAPIDDDLDRPSRRPEADLAVDDEKPVEPKPEKELVRPSTSAAGGSAIASIFDRPRVPPRIARPVPISEKRKFSYPGQKTTSTTAIPLSDEYYDDEEYDELSPAKEAPAPVDSADERDPPRRKIQDELNSRRTDDLPLRRTHSQTRRGSDDYARRPGRPFPRKTVEPARKANDDYDSVPLSNESDEKVPARKRPYAGREKIVDDVLPLTDEAEDTPKIPLRKRPNSGREKPVDDVLPLNDEVEEKIPARKRPYAGREKPVDDVLPLIDEVEEKIPARKRPYTGREKYVDDVNAEDTRDYRPRGRDSLRRPQKKEDPVVEDTREQRLPPIRRRPQAPAKVQPEPVDPVDETEAYDEAVDTTAPEKAPEGEKPQREGRPVVRVVKRPFLPSRGGSPYLARGLQPVGAALKQSTTDSTPIDMGSTISGVRLLEHGAPILRDSADYADTANPRKGPRTTLPPQVEYPKATLDELYENDYDVTLNDALNPTLKPLSSSNRNYLGTINKYDRGGYSAAGNGGDSYYSSTDVRRRTLPAPRNTRQEFRGASRIAQHFYEDFEY